MNATILLADNHTVVIPQIDHVTTITGPTEDWNSCEFFIYFSSGEKLRLFYNGAFSGDTQVELQAHQDRIRLVNAIDRYYGAK